MASLARIATVVVGAGEIIHVFYPVFPPGKSANQVIDWLKSRHRQLR